MAGVIGNEVFTGANFTVTGTTAEMLNPVDVIPFNEGDVVTKVSVYLGLAPNSDVGVTVGLYSMADFSSGLGDGAGATLVWSDNIVVPNGTPSGSWFDILIPNGVIAATATHELGVAVSNRVSGASSLVLKQSQNTSNKSNGAVLDPAGDLTPTFAVTATPLKQLALTVTTEAGAVTQDSNVLSSPSWDTLEAPGPSLPVILNHLRNQGVI